MLAWPEVANDLHHACLGIRNGKRFSRFISDYCKCLFFDRALGLLKKKDVDQFGLRSFESSSQAGSISLQYPQEEELNLPSWPISLAGNLCYFEGPGKIGRGNTLGMYIL